jgi:hypothetical protein
MTHDDQTTLFDVEPSGEEESQVASVAVGYLHSTEITIGFHGSVMNMLWHDQHGPDAPNRIGALLPVVSGVNVSGPRNDLVKQFLSTSQTWLLMLDSDMVFAPTLIDQMLEHADPETVPVLGGLCFGQARPIDGISVPVAFPTLYRWERGGADAELYLSRLNDYPVDSLMRVDATGAACLLVHRAVFEYTRTPEYEPFPWFSEGAVNGRYIGEDISFFMRLRDKVPVHVHTGIKIGHQKTWVVDEDVYKLQRELEWPLPGSSETPMAESTPSDDNTTGDNDGGNLDE